MVKALKGDTIKGYFDTVIGGKTVRFNQSNANDFVKRIPAALAKVVALEIEGPATLVPIPNSHVTTIDAANFKTLELAKAMAAASGGKLTALPALVFNAAQQKSRTGGPRSTAHFEEAYRVVSEVFGPSILRDDVCTSGGHLIGAFRKLNSPPTREVVLACAFGRSTRDQVNTPVGVRKETLDVSSPFDF
jgi:predicted amidophosphoribosyltransferase